MTITRVSTAADGTQGDSSSSTAALGTSQVSADGRYVVFASGATNLVAGDANGQQDIFVKDTLTGAVTLVSTATDGTQAGGSSSNASISADGRSVAFQSSASNLVADDTNGQQDIFVKDLRTGTLTRVSTDSAGTQGDSAGASISADGRHVAFQSVSSNLVAGDTNNLPNIFVKDLSSGTVTRVSTDATGAQANNSSQNATISADGTRVAFQSNASNLVGDDTNGTTDIFVKNLSSGTVTRVSTDATGAQGNGVSSNATISADGTRVAFQSNASNLVGDDTNGTTDIFVKNLSSGTVIRVSTDGAGAQGNGASINASISADGTRVAFQSTAGNLVTGDTNSQRDVFVKDLSGGGTTRVSTDGAGLEADNASFNPSISADGRRVAFTSADSALVADDTNAQLDVFLADSVCYAGGTRIRTTRGEVAVEDLAVGDLAVTASGPARPIRWLGHRTLPCRDRADRMPVRIAAGAFGPDRPVRDLLVSPAHAVCVDLVGEVLIPAGRLVNGTTVAQVAAETVTYWHVELDAHDILMAEGLPAESYLACGNRAFFAQADVVDLDAAPDTRPEDPPPFCRPFHETGALVDLVRARLETRARGLGWSLVEEPLAGLHLVADGRVIHPGVRGLTARFVLPADARDVRLVSDTTVPAHVLPASRDDRRLGVSLAGLGLDDGLTGARRIALDDARLTEGFHAPEGDGAAVWRWTDGAARLPPDLWAGCEDTVFLQVRLSGPALPRWVGPQERAGVIDRAGIRRRA